MFDQLNDVPYWLIRERLVDLDRDRRFSEQDEARPSIFDRLGDLLISLGGRIKRQAPCPETKRELAWLDRK